MEYKLMNEFLAPSKHIDWKHPDVLSKAKELATGTTNKIEIAKRCFEFVRDEIKHSIDYQLNPVTCKASQVLQFGTGFCYAKSHLLAALLRANGIPTGLCYQRLTIKNEKPPYSLHGLNAIKLDNQEWFRIDARGNKPGVNAEFSPPVERLAFSIVAEGEADLPEIWAEPLPVVVQVLESCSTFEEVLKSLPDMQPLKSST